MALTGVSLFLSFICLRVFELSVENVRWGEQVHAQKGEDVSRRRSNGHPLSDSPDAISLWSQTGPPIDDHRADFTRNYEAQKVRDS